MKLAQWILPGQLYPLRLLYASSNAIAVDLELTWQYPLSFVPNKPGRRCENRFHISQWASTAACMITSFMYHVVILCITNCYLVHH